MKFVIYTLFLVWGLMAANAALVPFSDNLMARVQGAKPASQVIECILRGVDPAICAGDLK